MPDTDHSGADVLRELLVFATSSTIYFPGGGDPRAPALDELATTMHQALDGDLVDYATH
jgi:hypothetical protein